MNPVRAEELVVAVNELVTNSIVHGGGAGVLSIWLEDGRLVCDVHDWGGHDDRLAGSSTPGPPWHHGHGLCLVNELCDLVQLRSSRAGATARVGVALQRTGQPCRIAPVGA
jgi:anti-sigma regulatory factor (Ser/Thr protein kinase)